MVKTDILVVTALALEFKAVERLLSNSEIVTHDTGSRYKRGVFVSGQRDLSVAVVEAGAGNVNAAWETERALSFFDPEHTFFVGVAGGIKDVKVGDIVVSSEVIHYEGGKAGEEYKPRLTTYPANYELMMLAKQIARDEQWQHRINDGLGTFRAEIKPIAAGEKVVASERSAVYELINHSVSQALAIEMEGYGFLAPIHTRHAKGIVIRGISDLLENKAAADASGSQPLAARNAAAFLAEMLAELTKNSASSKKSAPANNTAVNPVTEATVSTNQLDDLKWRHQLAKTLSELYEFGPTESNGAWKRAGGRVGFLSNNSSSEAQWFTALERLAQGGAGDITLISLLEAAKSDFKTNPTLNQLCIEAGLL